MPRASLVTQFTYNKCNTQLGDQNVYILVL